MEKYWIRKTVPFYESVKSCKITLTEYLSGIMINIRKTRKECTGPVWGGCAKNVMKVIKNKTINKNCYFKTAQQLFYACTTAERQAHNS